MRNSRYRNVVDTEYPAIRRVMVTAGDRLDDSELERVVERNFYGADPEDVENFFRTVQRFGSMVAPLAQKALPGIAKGAIQGAAVGGPFGGIVGALGGGAASLLSGGRPATGPTGRAPQPPAVPAQPPMATPVPPTTAPVAAPTPTSAPGVVSVGPVAPAPEMPAGAQPGTAATPRPDSAARVAWLVSRPEMWQSLLGMLMGSQGRQAVPVGNTQMPAGAFANALAEFAAEWAESSAGGTTGTGEHLVDSNGMPRGDIANPRERAALLLTDLAEVAADEEDGERSESDEAYENFSDSQWGDTSNAIDVYEAALEGRY